MNHRGSLLLITRLSITRLALGFTLLGFFLLAPGAFAQNTVDTQNTVGTGSHARIVRISYLQGTVQYNGVAAVTNSPVTEESRLVTGADGVAEVEFEDHSAIRIASETQISFAQLARLSTGEAMTRVDLEGGEAEFLIPASSAGRFAVNALGKNILFKQPGRFRILSTQETPLEIVVWKGEAGVRDLATDREVAVKARETFALNPQDLGQYNIENSVLADNLDRWSEQRDRDLRTNYVVSNTYNNTVYDQYYQSGGYGGTFVAPYSDPFFYGYNAFGCSTGFGQPFWFGSAGCGGAGFFFSPFFSPFFFSPVVVIAPPILPRHPVPIRPPTISVAEARAGKTVVTPRYQSFRDQGQSLFGESKTALTPSTIPRNVPVHGAVPGSRPPTRPPSGSFSGSRPSGGSFSHASAPAHSSGGGRGR